MELGFYSEAPSPVQHEPFCRRARSASWCALLLLCLGCAGPQKGSPAGEIEPCTTVADAARLRGIVSRPGFRTLADLDVDGDGRISNADAVVFENVHREATARLPSASVMAGGYYQGPAEGQPPVLSLVRENHCHVDLSSVPKGRLAELAIESRWLGLQAQLAAAEDEVPSAELVGGMLRDFVAGFNPDAMEPAAVCGAMEQLASHSYGGLPPVAIFDLDSTLWAGNGTDVFLAALIADNLPRPEANPALQAFLKTVPGVDADAVDAAGVLDNAKLLLRRTIDTTLPAEQRVSPKDAFYNLVLLLKGVRVNDAQRAAHQAIQQGAPPLPAWKERVFADRDGCGSARLVRLLVDHGVEVYLLSATPDVLVQEAGRLFGLPAERVRGSVLEVQDGEYTGRVLDNTYYVKGPITRQWLPAPPLVAFGDSPTSDFAMLLEATGAGFMINPRPSFVQRDLAEAGGRFVSLSFDGTEGELARAR